MIAVFPQLLFISKLIFVPFLQAGYNPLMLAVANNVTMGDHKDVLCKLVDKTGVNTKAAKV